MANTKTNVQLSILIIKQTEWIIAKHRRKKHRFLSCLMYVRHSIISV